MIFRDVYDEHFSFVWRSLRRLGVPTSDTPDAVQEVFVVVHRRLVEFEARSKMTTWLFGICLRVATSRRRRAHVLREVSAENVPEPADSGADMAANLDRRQRLGVLEKILNQLPLDQRAVFVAFELEGMSGEQIAELLDIPVGTVHSRLRLARGAFHDLAHRFQAQDRFPLQTGERDHG